MTYIYQLTVVNDEGVELPNTGDPGKTSIYFFGLVLTCIASAGMVIAKRKRNVA